MTGMGGVTGLGLEGWGSDGDGGVTGLGLEGWGVTGDGE